MALRVILSQFLYYLLIVSITSPCRSFMASQVIVKIRKGVLVTWYSATWLINYTVTQQVLAHIIHNIIVILQNNGCDSWEVCFATFDAWFWRTCSVNLLIFLFIKGGVQAWYFEKHDLALGVKGEGQDTS